MTCLFDSIIELLVSETYVAVDVTSTVVDVLLVFVANDSSLVVVDEAIVGLSVKSLMSVVSDVITNIITYHLLQIKRSFINFKLLLNLNCHITVFM